MSAISPREPTALQGASLRYADITALRAAMQAVPYVGGALDTLFGGAAAKFQQDRIEDFIAAVGQQLNRLKNPPLEEKRRASEELMDLFRITTQGAAKARSHYKRERFAAIFARQISVGTQWTEAEDAARLLDELSELHIAILESALNSPEAGGVWKGCAIVTLGRLRQPTKTEPDAQLVFQGVSSAPDLYEVFRDAKRETLRLHVTELVSRGLLHDEGVGRVSTPAMLAFVATDLARWWRDWVADLPDTLIL